MRIIAPAAMLSTPMSRSLLNRSLRKITAIAAPNNIEVSRSAAKRGVAPEITASPEHGAKGYSLAQWMWEAS